MPRPPRVHDPGSLWHMLSRGVQGQPIFDEEAHYQRFLRKLGEFCPATDHRLYAYVLMPNHFHFLLLAGKHRLADLMQPLLSSHAHYLSARRERPGHVFQGRYQSIPCERDEHLLELVRYLHLNPVRGGLAKSPEDYPWSSHGAYLGEKTPAWLLASEALQLFSSNRGAAVRQYRRFIQDGLQMGHRPDFYPRLGPGRAGPRIEAATTERAQAAVEAICKMLGLKPAELRTERRSPVLTQARALAAYFLTEALSLPIVHAARLLGRARGSVYHDLTTGRALAASARFSKLLGSLTRARET